MCRVEKNGVKSERGTLVEMYFDAQTGANEPPAFTLTFDPEALMLQSVVDLVSFNVQATMQRVPTFWSKAERQHISPTLLTLGGVLSSPAMSQGNQGLGASLVSADSFPLTFASESGQFLTLSFHCTRSYLQYIEEQRSASPGPTASLVVSLWATMALPSVQSKEEPARMQLVRLQSRQVGAYLNISRSHWADMLLSIGYPQRRSIELPILVTLKEDSAELKSSIAHLNEAHALFAQDRYREAVQRCRQARDALLGEDKKTWSEMVLSPIIGVEKAAMINEGVKALNNVGNVASHGANIEIDREVAEYVLGSMALILRYLARKFR